MVPVPVPVPVPVMVPVPVPVPVPVMVPVPVPVLVPVPAQCGNSIVNSIHSTKPYWICVSGVSVYALVKHNTCLRERERQTERHTETHRETETERQRQWIDLLLLLLLSYHTAHSSWRSSGEPIVRTGPYTFGFRSQHSSRWRSCSHQSSYHRR